MRTRTTLTTSPGATPTDDTVDEFWYPAFALPSEPGLPSRWRSVLVWIAVVAVMAGSLYGAYRITQRGTNFDPALDRDVTSEAPAFDSST